MFRAAPSHSYTRGTSSRLPSENVPELRSFTSRRPSTFSPRKQCSVQRPAYRTHGARLADFRRKTFQNSVHSLHDVRPRFRLENHVPCIAQPIVDTGHVQPTSVRKRSGTPFFQFTTSVHVFAQKIMFRAAPSQSDIRGTSSRLPPENVSELRYFTSRRPSTSSRVPSENVPELRSFTSRRPSTFRPENHVPCSAQPIVDTGHVQPTSVRKRSGTPFFQLTMAVNVFA